MSTNFCLPFHETPATQRLSAAMQRAKEKADEAVAAAAEKQATTPVKMLLPGLNESVRAIPNYIARSAIFAPVRKGCRQIHDDTVFLEGPNILLKGSGKQLSEDHSDIWMHAMYLQTTVLVGEAPVINRADFLRGMGRPTGGSAYDWLHDGMKDLSRFTICIEARRRDGSVKYSYGQARSCRLLAMIGGFDYQESTGLYTLYADPRWAQIFGNREFALLDWAKRLNLRHDLSKSLQRLIGTSSDERQKYTLETLKDRAQYTSPMRKFRGNLERSLAELEACGIIARPCIETGARGQEMASWTRL
ncbi:TrfA [Castellaniella denitrificans]|uniref:TrfA n=1 Tax=Castellaniella denitrificans TaxID=56119 RepID=A0ABT4M314_9BURK|nr:TrfA [Castellaniella denitrificans]MCZ4328496.1 TrfA [Castellaniella denitrificans]